ncbi:hypothetical protein PMAYCL1PPCAC_32867, partial [Pristionchus mayeri]
MSYLRFSGRILSLCFVILIAIHFFLFSSSFFQPPRSTRTFTPSHHSINHFEPILLYRAYYDNRNLAALLDLLQRARWIHPSNSNCRTGPGRIRILAISPCLPSSTHFSISVGHADVPLTHSPLEGKCPWGWAPDCKWNAYHLQTPTLSYQNSTV